MQQMVFDPGFSTIAPLSLWLLYIVVQLLRRTALLLADRAKALNAALSLKWVISTLRWLEEAGLNHSRVEAAPHGEICPLVATTEVVAEPRNRSHDALAWIVKKALRGNTCANVISFINHGRNG